MAIDFALLRMLSDGNIHSGVLLGERLDVSRPAIWKKIQQINALGIKVETIARQGYRLQQQINWLDAKQLAHSLTLNTQDVFVFDTIGSTNDFVMANLDYKKQPYMLALAEMQTQGRGRHGSKWLSPIGQNIYLSIGVAYAAIVPDIATLSLAISIRVAEQLRKLGVHAWVKWPNDIFYDNRKLGGFLIESRLESHGPCHVVVGMGLNLWLSESDQKSLDRPSAYIQQSKHLSRNFLLQEIIPGLNELLLNYHKLGFQQHYERWSEFDLLRDRTIQIIDGDKVHEGIAKGINRDGSLILQTSSGVKNIYSGEASIGAL